MGVLGGVMLGASSFLPFFLPFFLFFLSFLPLSLFLPMTVPPALSITIQDTSRFSRGPFPLPKSILDFTQPRTDLASVWHKGEMSRAG